MRSDLARKIDKALGCAVIDDVLFSDEELEEIRSEIQSKYDEKLRYGMDILKTNTWIIDGNYGRTIEMRLKYCDTVFLQDYPLEVCLAGAKARVGKKREEIPWVEEELDEGFRQWIIDFPETKLPQIYGLPEQYGAGKEIHLSRSREDANKYLESING